MQAVCYEVTLDAEEAIAAALQDYMVTKHVPEIFATGCFESIRFQQQGATRFRTQYWAIGQTQLDEYLAQHSAATRADFMAHFPRGVAVQRAVWELRAEWRAA